MAAERIDPVQAHADIASGALLICAYDDPARFDQNHLEGALSLDEFQAREAWVPRSQELVFYCA